MWLGFALASYSVVGNDVIQTLGTFLTSNEKRPWWILWLFASTILTLTLLYSWFTYDGDVSYQRLIGDASDGFSIENPKYPLPDPFAWYYLLPPLVLMLITRFGIPVSTSFLILTFFVPKGLVSMATKSFTGYLVAFVAAILVYLLISKVAEKRFVNNPITERQRKIWMPLQWFSTGFLWTQWLAQDFANIYVYLPREISVSDFFISLFIILSLLAYIFWSKGGKIQDVVRSKSNTSDIRSATIIDFIYGIILFYFKELNNVPMSTTWVFIGLLAGREIGIALRTNKGNFKEVLRPLIIDFAKVTLGLVISIILVFLIRYLSSGSFSF